MYCEVHDATRCCHDSLQAKPGFRYFISSVCDAQGNFQRHPVEAFGNVYNGATEEKALAPIVERAKQAGCKLYRVPARGTAGQPTLIYEPERR